MVKSAKPPVALIAGPTASGKSALALALAGRRDGVLINADSAQIYSDLPVLSAAPGASDRAFAEHRLYGFRDGAQPCSAAEWAAMARHEIAEVHARGRLPILVGGTGLYIRTLLDGIAPVPAIEPEVRRRVRQCGVAENRAELERLDPDSAARIGHGDTARTARALEVIVSTGRSLSAWQASREGGIGAKVSLLPMILLPPRDWLYPRCDARFEGMLEQGAIAEVEVLLGRGLDPSLPVMRAIGAREIAAFLAGEIDRGEAIRRSQQSTRNYAKRQFTWFAHQPPPGWPRFEKPMDDAGIAEALALLDQTQNRLS